MIINQQLLQPCSERLYDWKLCAKAQSCCLARITIDQYNEMMLEGCYKVCFDFDTKMKWPLIAAYTQKSSDQHNAEKHYQTCLKKLTLCDPHEEISLSKSKRTSDAARNTPLLFPHEKNPISLFIHLESGYFDLSCLTGTLSYLRIWIRNTTPSCNIMW